MKFRRGGNRAANSLLIVTLSLVSVCGFAQQEPAAVVEIGAAPAWSITSAGGNFSPTIAIEMTPIEDRLEIELGISPTFTRHSTEWDTDILFKKPWTLSKKVEFMFGRGPEWIIPGNTARQRVPSPVKCDGLHVLAHSETQIRLVP